jgi:predicted permease
MLILREWIVRVAGTFRRNRSDQDLEDELRLHLELAAEDAQRRSASPQDARRLATIDVGSVAQAADVLRDQRGFPWLEDGWHDALYVLRKIRLQPGFAVVIVVTLALSIGANTAILGIIDTLLLRPPPIQHIERLVSFQESNRQKISFDVDPSPGNFLDWREHGQRFDQLAAWRNWYFALGEPQSSSSQPSESVRGVNVSPNFFSLIGVVPALGRNFRLDEETPGSNRTVLLSDRIWRRRFGADVSIVGRKVMIDGQPSTVIGVLPSGFQFFQPDLDVWMPLVVDTPFHNRQNHSVMVFGRLGVGVSLEQAQHEIDAIAAGLARSHPETNAGWGVRLSRVYPTTEVRALRPALVALLGAAGLVLLIANVNVANLLLARGIARHREIALRASLGATRTRLIRQMLTESVFLATVSGLAGAIVADWGIGLLVPLLPHVGTNQSVSAFSSPAPVLDMRMLGLSIGIGIVTGIVFGVIPAFQTTQPDALRAGASTHLKPRAARMLLLSELGLALVLLTGAALVTESFWKLQKVDVGFSTDHLLTMQVRLPKTKYPSAEKVRTFYEDVVRRVNSVPGVHATSAISYRPFLGMGTGTRLEIEGRQPSGSQEEPTAEYRVVTAGFLRALGQLLVAGRDFTGSDEPNSDGAVVVNEAMAHRFWPGRNAIGQRLRPAFRHSDVPWELDAAPRWLTVIGVVHNIKGLAPAERDQSQMYVSSLQFPFANMFLVIRTAVPPLSLAASIETQIRSVDPGQPVADVRAMDDIVAASLPRLNVELLGLFALLAVTLAAVGVHGVTSYAVNQREQEIGIRMALGARSDDVLAMIIRETAETAIVAIAIGLLVSLGASRAISGMLYGVTPTDRTAYAGAAILLLIVVLVASYLPARRAARLDPAIILRV